MITNDYRKGPHYSLGQNMEGRAITFFFLFLFFTFLVSVLSSSILLSKAADPAQLFQDQPQLTRSAVPKLSSLADQPGGGRGWFCASGGCMCVPICANKSFAYAHLCLLLAQVEFCIHVTRPPFVRPSSKQATAWQWVVARGLGTPGLVGATYCDYN